MNSLHPVSKPADSAGLPVVVAGMHRSGTSMMTSFVQSLGVNVGSELTNANKHNRKGYFEDREFVELHRAIFLAACPADEPGYLEMGYTESERFDLQRVEAFTERARQLIEARRKQTVWGWKDPRTTLLLPFWHSLLPNARYVLVYRFPWDVADSLYRRGDRPTTEQAIYAYRIWMLYNRQLLAFYRQHPERCVLLNTNAIPANLGALAELLIDRLDLPFEAPAAGFEALFERQLMQDLPLDHPAIALTQAHFPEALALLRELDSCAHLPSQLESIRPSPVRAAEFHCHSIQRDPVSHNFIKLGPWWLDLSDKQVMKFRALVATHPKLKSAALKLLRQIRAL